MSQSQYRDATKLSRSAASTLRAELDNIAQLLEFERPVRKSEIEHDGFRLTRLERMDIVERVDRKPTDSSWYYTWRLTDDAEQYARDILEERDELPCGHSGIENIHNGGYSCAFDGCDAEFSRDTVEEVLGW